MPDSTAILMERNLIQLTVCLPLPCKRFTCPRLTKWGSRGPALCFLCSVLVLVCLC